ncbi:MAG: 6-phosphofructokinase [Patescibacteria group bacterium]
MKIFIFTGGGLAPTLNSTIYGIVEATQNLGWEVYGGLFGWASLLKGGKHVRLDNLDLKPLLIHGGTILRSSRTNPFKVEGGAEQIKQTIKDLKIDGIIAIGGDDTLNAARRLAEMGLPVVAVPKTIDNDLSGTYFTPGFPSAAHYLKIFTSQIKEDAAYALSRIFVIESQGMKAGWLAASAIYGGADVIIPSEGVHDLDKVLTVIKDRYQKNGNYAVVVVAQEAQFKQKLEIKEDIQIGEQYGHKRQSFICLALREIIKERLGVDTKALYPGNFLESDEPITLDRDMARLLGAKAVGLLEQKKYGLMACIVRPKEKKLDLKIEAVLLSEAVGDGKYRALPADFFDVENFKPTQKFLDYMAPIAGVFNEKDDDYTKLIKKITASA